jgi:release factor glutamine methyltransferase
MPSQSVTIAAGTTVEAAMKSSPLDMIDTRILVMHALQLSRTQLITQDRRALTADEAQRLSALFQRRLQGEPIAYITGEREFYGLSFHVTPDVLIPRPETELLVELAIERMPQHGCVLDMGTGSGAIPVAIAHTLSDAVVTALDVSEAALAIARGNAARNKVRVEFLHSDWYAALAVGNIVRRFHVIVSNPPYIVAGDMHLSQGDLLYEPIDALTDHGDGLTALRTIIASAPDHLAPDGWLLLEHGYDQADAVRALLAARGFVDVQSWKDLAGIERVGGGRLAA